MYEVWLRWSERVDGEIRSGIRVLLDLEQPAEATDEHDAPQIKRISNGGAIGKGGVEGIDVGYSKLKDHVEKSLILLAEGELNSCAICARDIGPQATTLLVCPNGNCRAASHMTCLAARFLDIEKQEAHIIPTSGNCPQCHSEIQWIDLVKEMSLRVRGKAHLVRMIKKQRGTKMTTQRGYLSIPEKKSGEVEDLCVDGEGSESANDLEEPLPDDWEMSVARASSNIPNDLGALKPGKSTSSVPRLETEIQDSECDDSEILD